MAEVSLPQALQKFVENQRTIVCNQSTLLKCFQELESRFPDLRGKLLTDSQELQRYVRVFVDNQDYSSSQMLESVIAKESKVKIIMALAGG